ncbi:hypothetical protein ACQP0C_41735 (plasmid) [Nocardia sp. CA-129566]|uniref:hypothetical protein n=1 Tax=Nocardia sp. CA-129566 TaxID=3239976 RepID=UPI003D98683E
MTLIQLTIPLRNGGHASVTGQRLTEHFAVAPALRIEDDATVGFADHGRVLNHIPTGRVVTHSVFVDYIRFATELEALPIDWANFAQLTAEQAQAIKDAHQRVSSEQAPAWPWPEWAGDESSPALSLLGTLLDDGAQDARRDELVDKLTSRATELDSEFGTELGNQLRWMLAGIHTTNYSAVWLLAVLHRVDPAAADQAAKELACALDAGDALGEWTYQWRQELADQIPLTLHGFPDLPTPIS